MHDKRRCKVCGHWFTGRSDKIYCSASCRHTDWQDEKAGKPSAQPCEYCGQPADSIDNVPPQSARQFIKDSGLASRFPFKEVWACRECNSILGARAIFTITARRKFIKKVLRIRYKKFLKIPEWRDTELTALGHTLRSTVLNGVIMKELVEARLAWKG